MKKITIKEAFKKSGEIEIFGWVHENRDLKNLRFIILKDITGRIQVTAIKGKTNDDIFNKIPKITRESAIRVKGKIISSDIARGGKEVLPDEIEILGLAKDPLPVDASDYSKTELPQRLDYRFLDMHGKKAQSIFKVQATIMQAFREFMIKNNALEVNFPSIISSSSEGGTELFEVRYFEKKAYLSQSCQLYKQMLACAVGKVFSVFTVWRAEKHNTPKHLNESRQFDYEEAFADEMDVMKVLEELVTYIAKKVKEENKEELDFLKAPLEVPKAVYMTFDEAKKILIENKISGIEEDLTNEAEKKLGELYPNTLIFIYKWPISGKPFYIMPLEDGYSRGFDVLWNGIELSSGGQRVHKPEILIKRLKECGLNPKDFEKYIDSFRYGAPPHAGWAIGLERLTMIMLKLNNIREAVLFPRDRERLNP